MRYDNVVNINSLERDGLRQAELCPRHTMKHFWCPDDLPRLWDRIE